MNARTIPIQSVAATPVAQEGCHAPAGTLVQAAKQAGKSELLDQLARDYPRGEG